MRAFRAFMHLLPLIAFTSFLAVCLCLSISGQ